MDKNSETERVFGASSLDKVLALFDRLDDEMDALCEEHLHKRLARVHLNELHSTLWAEKLADLEEEYQHELDPTAKSALMARISAHRDRRMDLTESMRELGLAE